MIDAANPVAYAGDVSVLITDVSGATIYSGPLQAQTTQILNSIFPLSITVTPADGLLY